ncbi:MAG: hypothetical protein HQM06_17805 [Magnetococcales bacterium]|nr:hypothetical protein [Magnetococcales bacterium]
MPLQIEHWSLDRLIPYARNPRRNDEVVDRRLPDTHEPQDNRLKQATLEI